MEFNYSKMTEKRPGPTQGVGRTKGAEKMDQGYLISVGDHQLLLSDT